MTRKLKFGLIGLGEIAYKSTGQVFGQTQYAEMVAGMDVVEDVARSYEETFGIPCTTDLDDVLGNPEVEAVVVSTPHHLHVPLGIEAAKAGKHVIVEKPMATTLEDADALIEACRRANVLCASKEAVSVYTASAHKARELMQAGVIGEVMAIQLFGQAEKPESYWTGGYSGRVQTTWRKSKKESGGGILVMNYIYDMHRIRFITGLEVSRVFAEYGTYRTAVEVEDFITVSLRYDNGALGVISISSCVPGTRAPGGTGVYANRIIGTEGQISFEGKGLSVYTEKGGDGLEAGAWNAVSCSDDAGPFGYAAYFDRFAQAAMEGREPDFPGEEGRKNLEIILAAYRSGEIHAPVDLPM